MIIESCHRSERLALRHLAQLRREYASAEIISRRNRRGRFSKYGKCFQFEVQEATGEQTEIVLHFDYAGGKDNSRIIRFQIHIIGPADVSDAETLRVVRDHFTQKKAYPKGWKEKSIHWGARRDPEPDRDYNPKIEREKYLAYLAFSGEGRTISRKITAKKNRRPRKGKKK